MGDRTRTILIPQLAWALLVIKDYVGPGLVAVAVHEVKTGQSDTYHVPVAALWGWLDQWRPCWVYRAERRYWLGERGEP